MKITHYFAALLLGLTVTSCGDDFFDDPDSSALTPEQIAKENEKDPDKVLAGKLKGCYSSMNTQLGMATSDINAHQSYGFGGIMSLADVMSNDISLKLGNGDPWHYDHELDYNGEQYIRPRWPWGVFYTIVKSANDLINVCDEDNATQSVKNSLGQAYAFRGMAHFYLAQFYQKTYIDSKDLPCVPILLSGKETSIKSRATVEQVYAQVEADLLKAIDYLDGFNRSDKQTIDKQVAEGLLARVYLVMNRWADAAAMAHAARQGYPLNDRTAAAEWNYQDLTNPEVMWGWIPTEDTKGYYASWGSWHSTDGPGYGGAQVGAFQLIDAALYNSLPEDDVRKQLFVAPGHKVTLAGGFEIPEYANLKFPFVANWLGNLVYMRASEMYLVEAEGLLMSGDAGGAANVMAEFMPNRVAGWAAPASYTQDDIYQQRRIELWGEGFAYYDCLRLHKDLVRTYPGTNEPLSSQANVPASSYQWIYQIPKTEINDNTEISEEDQNPLK